MRDADGKWKELYKPCAEGENDRYVFVLLSDDETLAESTGRQARPSCSASAWPAGSSRAPTDEVASRA